MSIKFKTIAGAGLACALLGLPPHAMAQDYSDDPQVQIERLSEQLRKLTGQNEELQHQNQVLQQQLQQMQAGGGTPRASDAPGRSGQALPQPAPSYQGQAYQNQPYQNQPAQTQSYQPPPRGGYQSPQPAYQDQAPINAPYSDSPPPIAASSGGRRGDAFDPSQNPNAPGAPRALGGGQLPINPNAAPGAPLNLEAVPQAGYAPPPQEGASASLTTAPPTASPKDEFDLGIGYMQRKDYGLAAETMQNFIAKYPNERLVGDAQYWFGESLFQRHQYREAAEAFLTVTSKYDRSGKAPDAMLRLGQSLAALKEKDAACAAFSEITRKYPKASSGVKQGVAREQKRTGC